MYPSVREAASAKLRTLHGEFRVKAFEAGEERAIALVSAAALGDNPLVRIQSACLFGETFGSNDCDCRWQIQHTLDLIGREGGVFIYLFQEGRGVGLVQKIKAYDIEQTRGVETDEAFHALGYAQADLRNYDLACSTLMALGISKCRLLTGSHEKLAALTEAGINTVSISPANEPSDYKDMAHSLNGGDPTKLMRYMEVKKRLGNDIDSEAIRDAFRQVAREERQLSSGIEPTDPAEI